MAEIQLPWNNCHKKNFLGKESEMVNLTLYQWVGINHCPTCSVPDEAEVIIRGRLSPNQFELKNLVEPFRHH